MSAAGAVGSLVASSFHPGEHFPDNEALLADLGPVLHLAGRRIGPLRFLWLEKLFRGVQNEGTGIDIGVFVFFT